MTVGKRVAVVSSKLS